MYIFLINSCVYRTNGVDDKSEMYVTRVKVYFSLLIRVHVRREKLHMHVFLFYDPKGTVTISSYI